MLFTTVATQIDDLLRRVADGIQLDSSRRERAESAYSALSAVLEKHFSTEDVSAYPQGSFLLGTTVRPMQGDEFDLDFVVQLGDRSPFHSVTETLEQVVQAVKSDQRYAGNCEKKTRCVRVNYQNEFHVDILPAIADPSKSPPAILVPDRQLNRWTPSSPKGYLTWFDNRCNETSVLAKAFAAEPLPDDESLIRKAPLKVAVQLLKRRRDIVFEGADWRPSSIVLTTLLALHYRDEISPFHSLTDSLIRVIRELDSTTWNDFRLPNPSNDDEYFTDKWPDKRACFDELFGFLSDFSADCRGLEMGTQDTTTALSDLFGEHVVAKAVASQAMHVRKSKDLGGIIIGKDTKTPTKVRSNTFYGSAPIPD